MYIFYNKKEIINKINELKKLNNVNRIYYAVKANYNYDILLTIANENIGFECIDQMKLLY